MHVLSRKKQRMFIRRKAMPRSHNTGDRAQIQDVYTFHTLDKLFDFSTYSRDHNVSWGAEGFKEDFDSYICRE